MRTWAILLLALSACSFDGSRSNMSESATTVATPALTFDQDQWTGEVEWALVEECALHGLSDCAPRIEQMRLGECSVGSSRLTLESLASASPQEHARRVSEIIERGDCQLLDESDWVLSTR